MPPKGRKGIVFTFDWRYNHVLTAADVRKLTAEEKLQIMETIWEDFQDRFGQMEISDERTSCWISDAPEYAEGKARLLDWDEVKGTVGRA